MDHSRCDQLSNMLQPQYRWCIAAAVTWALQVNCSRSTASRHKQFIQHRYNKDGDKFKVISSAMQENMDLV